MKKFIYILLALIASFFAVQYVCVATGIIVSTVWENKTPQAKFAKIYVGSKDLVRAYHQHVLPAIDSGLRTTGVTSQGWMEAAESDPGPVSPLLRTPGFCIWREYFDIMHTLDLGVLTHASPSVLTVPTAAADVFPAATREGRLQLATQSYRTW